MPTSVAAVLVFLFALVPGYAGERLFRLLVGWNWRESVHEYAFRLLSFSTGGAALYVVVAPLLHLPAMLYLFPDRLRALQPPELGLIFVPYLGHFLGSLIAAGVAAAVLHLIGRWSARSPFPAAWDDFIRTHVSDHWVVVSLKSGDTYTGKIASADISVVRSDPDLVLEEPASYSEGEGYRATSYQHIYLPCELIDSVASVSDPETDRRSTDIGEILFPETGNLTRGWT